MHSANVTRANCKSVANDVNIVNLISDSIILVSTLRLSHMLLKHFSYYTDAWHKELLVHISY